MKRGGHFKGVCLSTTNRGRSECHAGLDYHRPAILHLVRAGDQVRTGWTTSTLVWVGLIVFIIGLFGLWVNETAGPAVDDTIVPSLDMTWTKAPMPNTNYHPLFLRPKEA